MGNSKRVLNTMVEEVIEYIISFLLYGNKEAVHRVQLASPVDWTLRYPNLDTIPSITRGSTNEDDQGYHVIVSPDLIYNTFFFLSRAEELLNPQRDEHKRFLAKYSLLGQQNRLQTPLVDVYAHCLLQALGLPIPSQEIANVCLTHDIDTIDYYRHTRGAIGGFLRGEWRKIMASWRDIKNDPAYTFPWLEAQDAKCQKKSSRCEVIYFVKQTLGKGYDYPQYSLQRLPHLNASYGLHSSYYGALPKEKKSFIHSTASIPLIKRNLHRSHYLRCSIEQMEQLVQYGITDDYTMGFADRAGFRLQTCRPVRWINPKTFDLTPLTLHPLSIMDCTLSNANYMHLNEEQALHYCQSLITQTRLYHGELVLLWHNNTPSHNPYHFTIYPQLLALITE